MTAITNSQYFYASNKAATDYFGLCVAMGTKYIVVGAPYTGVWDVGTAYIYEISGGSLIERAILNPSSPGNLAHYGIAVAIFNDDTVAVGAPGNNDNAVYIYTRSGDTWSEAIRIPAPSTTYGTYEFGCSLAFSETGLLLVGANKHREASSTITGGAFLFSGSGASWSLITRMVASDYAAGDNYGISVDIEGDTAVIGAYQDDDTFSASGSIYVHKKSGGTWPLNETQKLHASDPAAGDYLGWKVSISGNTIVSGAYPKNTSQGKVYTFTRPDAGSAFPSTETQGITASDASSNSAFGISVSINGDFLAVGASRVGNYGKLYVYKYTTSWVEEDTLSGTPGVDEWFTEYIDFFGDYIVAGAPRNSPGGVANAGAAYLLTWGTPDTEPPYVENQDPAPDETGVGLNDHIILDVVDDLSGVDAAYTTIKDNSVIIWESGAAAAGWSGSATPITNGYRYDLVKDTPLAEGTLHEIEVSVRDLYGTPNSDVITYSFTTTSVAPYLQNQDPLPSAKEVAVDSNIYLEIKDANSNLVAVSIILKVNGTTAWTGDAEQAGFDVTKVVDAGVYKFTINPDIDFQYGIYVTVEVYAEDDAPTPGVLNTSYSFQTGAAEGTIYNYSFEIAGNNPGEADSWDESHDQGAVNIAAFEGSILPLDNFEAGWGGGNQLSHVEFEAADLQEAIFGSAEGSSIEDFRWAWRSPRDHVYCYVTNLGRSEPIYSQPSEAFTVGKKYVDLNTGGTAFVEFLETLEDPDYKAVQFTFVDHLVSINSLLGFCRNEVPGGANEEHIIAELNTAGYKLATPDGFQKRFNATIPNTPIHPQIEGRDATFNINVIIGREEYLITDNGAGTLISDAGILNTLQTNTIDYETGEITLVFNTAPDAGEMWAYYNYGLTVTSEEADAASNLPYISTVILKSEPTYELPSYNDAGTDAFSSDNLSAAFTDNFEQDWIAPNTGGPPYNEESLSDFDTTDLEAAVFDSLSGSYEDFEESWSNNQNAQATFGAGDLSTGPTENFETGWDSIIL